jgi:hypothetical protein
MINILSVSCSLAFAPYLSESLAQFLDSGYVTPRVVLQAGTGLIIRYDGELAIRYQEREYRLGPDEARHYRATTDLRVEAYDITLMTDEIVMSNFSGAVVLSHPQSEIWLEPPVVESLVQMFNVGTLPESILPEWLNASLGGGRLLLSDQRSGRWMLLGPDHVDALASRLPYLSAVKPNTKSRPPTIDIKGLPIHLQSAIKLARTFADFAATGAIEAYDEITPLYSLSVSPSTEGIELNDATNRVAITKREAGKWASLMSAELDRLNAMQFERGQIRTTLADCDGGRWILQWGDAVFIPRGFDSAFKDGRCENKFRMKRIGELTTLLDHHTAHCVALSDPERVALDA